jgi:hypothetical protein
LNNLGNSPNRLSKNSLEISAEDVDYGKEGRETIEAKILLSKKNGFFKPTIDVTIL